MDNPTQFSKEEPCASARICDGLELEKEKECIFLTFILSKKNSINICILSQCTVY